MLLEKAHQKRRKMISLTPLIDVVFMLSTNFNRWYQVNLQSATSDTTQTPELQFLKIQSNKGDFNLNGRHLLMSDQDAIREFVAENNKATFVITVVEGIQVQVMISLLDLLKKSGAARVSVAGVAP